VVVFCLPHTNFVQAQAPPSATYQRQQIFASYAEFKSQLQSIVAIADATQRNTQLDAFWKTLRDAGQVPYAQGNQYAFLYRGTATSVAFAGDFNSWNPASSSAPATNFAGTNLWIREGTLAPDGRTDYKVIVNNNWILDPANPLQMWSGLGGANNELRMPSYTFPQETVRNPATPRGTITADTRINSTNMSYGINYRVYTPAGYAAENLSNLPVVYVTDGHEYLADYLGSMPIVLDNLIAVGKLRPTIAVFIDPREPGNPGNNRRIAEYNMNPKFANFVAGELVPVIDAAYRTDATADGRTILGTSMGGLNAAYFGATKGDVFDNIAIQSPAYNQNSPIYALYQNNDLKFLDIFQTSGTLGGDGTGATQMAGIWTARGYQFSSLVANEGHSWGQWRGQLDDILIKLIGPPMPVPEPKSASLIWSMVATGVIAWSCRPGRKFQRSGRKSLSPIESQPT
jgi:enterochelin esterase family protein